MRSRTLSLAVSFISAIINFILAVRLLALWRSLRWDSESEWEGSADVWRVDPVKLVWGLLSVYFAGAAAASAVGFVGIARQMPTFVRFFRDYSIADLAFTTLSVVTLSYTSFTTSYVRSGVCEELSRQPELMRDMAETGLSLENCEFWFERAVVAILGMMFVLIAIRLQFVIALSKYHNQLRRDRLPLPKSHSSSRQVKADSMQRIYLLPTPSSPSSPSFPSNFTSNNTHTRSKSLDEVIVYAPVPLGGLSEEDARKMNATEAWISTSSSSSSQPRTHRHTRSHPYSHSHSSAHRHSHRNSVSSHRPTGSSSSSARSSEEKLLIDCSV